MSYYDSTLAVGHYHVGGSSVAHHTYAFIGQDHGEDWAFPCYGFVAAENGYRGATGVTFPEMTWTPYIVWPSRVGTQLRANLHVALGIAQNSRKPRYTFRFKDWDAYWEAGAIEGAACWGGIYYAIDGVCHQVCNRIMFSTREKDFDHTPINWPPSFTATYWVYGFWGKRSDEAFALARDLVADVKSRPATAAFAADESRESPPESPGGFPAEMLRSKAEAIGRDLKQPAQTDDRIAFVNQTLAWSDTALTSAPTQGVMEVDARFQSLKRELDIQLIRGEISASRYAQAVNTGFRNLTLELRNILPSENFAKLFPEAVSGTPFDIISPALIPAATSELQAYAQL